MESFLQNYGYLAVVLGTFIEGETILFLVATAGAVVWVVYPCHRKGKQASGNIHSDEKERP